MVPERFSGATHKEPPCFAAERGPDPFGHTRALGGPFFSELGWELSSAALRVMWPLVGPHTKNGPVLLQNVAPTPWSTHGSRKV